jgi:NAD(P)-dependent dehydrogenase (short-subunit alcohol dehydrogenase family)
MQEHVLKRLAELRDVTLDSISSKRLETVPLRRTSKPEETAGFVYFLISDEGKYITGQSLSQDGGITM